MEITNLSENMRAIILDVSNARRNDSSLTFPIEVLNLESVAIRRGLLEDCQNKKKNKYLEVLDLENLAERILKIVNFRDWSTN